VNLYIFDSSSFITPYRLYYAEDIVPSFWEQLEDLIENGKVCTIDKVKEEITKIDDQLSRRVKRLFKRAVPFRRKNTSDNLFSFGGESSEWIAYKSVISWAENSSYNKAAISEFKNDSKADAFLIAFCKTYNLTLVTEEVFKRKKKRIPIPNACSALNVRCLNLFDFMRETGIKI